MKLVPLGNTGEQVSEFCLGTMMFGARCDEAEADRILSAALERGVTFVDTAAMYAAGGTEEILGRLLRGRRDRVFLATKVHRGLDSASILTSIDESLARLKTDAVDLYLLHWPLPGMRPVEIMAALAQVVAAGKTRYVGCSNFPAWLLAHCNAIAAEHGWPRLVNNQVAYNLFERGIEVEILPQAVAERIAITVYRPLAEGVLAGRYQVGGAFPAAARGETSGPAITWLAQHGASIARFNRYAAELGVAPATLALAWVRYSAGVTAPIVGASRLSQLEDTLAAFELDLTDRQYEDVTAIFATEVWEEGLQPFPGRKYNFPRLRRNLRLLG
ncbi:MAG: aldo/keto reductase [Chloroflexi bacterium]|nr:aldo/keto reductase [Chloroflexota bacterium]